jgi:nitrite reductase/ring-hydroxylating ferredoxin subunit
MTTVFKNTLKGFLFGFFLLAVSCGKENDRTEIPYIYVNFVIYPNTLHFIPEGGYVYSSGGYKGLIIYRPLSDQFLVYERACPYDPLEDDARVVVEENGIIAIDSLCGSRFILTDGSPINGPATTGLKQYRTRYDGYSLTVTN